jgi:rhodanese-related sulfurtransferase
MQQLIPLLEVKHWQNDRRKSLIKSLADGNEVIMPLLKKVSWAALSRLIQARFPSVKHLSIAELANWLKSDDPPLLLDARTLDEYEVSHLPGAQLVTEDWLENGATGADSKPIVVYCSVGYRSAKLAANLQAQGLQQVFNLEGSIFAWANAGYPVYRSTEPVTQVHPYDAVWGKLLNENLHSKSPTH